MSDSKSVLYKRHLIHNIEAMQYIIQQKHNVLKPQGRWTLFGIRKRLFMTYLTPPDIVPEMRRSRHENLYSLNS